MKKEPPAGGPLRCFSHAGHPVLGHIALPRRAALSFYKTEIQIKRGSAAPGLYRLRRLPMGRLSTSVMPSAMATATFTVSMPFCTIMPLKPKMK